MDAATRHLWQINKYLWMNLAFVLFYLPVAKAQHLFSAPLWTGWALLLVALAEGVSRTWVAYRRGGSLPRRLGWVYNGLDIALISTAVGITKGVESDLWLLYFVVTIFESLYAAPLQKRCLDGMVITGYVLATLPCQLNPQLALPAPIYLRILMARLFFIVIVGALARRVSVNAEERNHEILLLREQMATAEERARIAREVHDGLGHALVSSILRLELCARLLRKAPAEAETLLNAEIPALRAAWNEGRDLAFHLRPWERNADVEGDFVDALRRHTGRFAERTGLVVTLAAEDRKWNLRPEVAFGLIRIVQEALTNVAKHAQATTIEITLIQGADGRIQCTLCDNGKGFTPDAQPSGFGLQAMRERATSLGGTFTLESAPECGTRIVITLPA